MNTSVRLLQPVPLALILAATFAAVGLVGFVPNPVVGAEGVFVTNAAHNVVHLVTAAAFCGVAWAGAGAAVVFMKVFGVVYLLTGVLGFVALGGAPQGHLLGVVHLNQMDNFLHLGLGVLIFGLGLLAERQPTSVSVASA